MIYYNSNRNIINLFYEFFTRKRKNKTKTTEKTALRIKHCPT